jgi:hypothetical protein|tara:strand:+ start:3497 stop:4198 length:702 start_codon:yes stop_codon:yes gene_type:complete
MLNLQLHETKKLHYGKYLYKLKLTNQLAGIFRTEQQRNGRLTFAKTKIQTYLQQYRRGETPTRLRWRAHVAIPKNELLDANTIYNVLKVYIDEYIVRCEYSTLTIYSNNRSMLLKISNKLLGGNPELWEPDPTTIDFLTSSENVILVDIPTRYPFKLTFGRKKANPALASWIDKNGDKVKAGPVLMENLRTRSWIQGQYIYVRDENVIFLLQILVGDNISRIDKLVYKDDIDK